VDWTPLLDEAFAWLCRRRRRRPTNAGVWHLRFHWAATKRRLLRELGNGSVVIGPPRRRLLREAGEVVDVREAEDALVVKAVALALERRLADRLSARCYHFPAGRGAGAAVREAFGALPQHRFVYRTDVRSYYDSIQPLRVMEQLRHLLGDDPLLRLVWQVLDRVVDRNGCLFEVRRGIARGCSLSPLIGALYLADLDRELARRDVFYVRFVDDILVLARTRWKLKDAIRRIRRHLAGLELELRPEKTCIGRVDCGFDWLGFRVTPGGVEPSAESVQRFEEKARRLYERDPGDTSRIGGYVQRWEAWAAGVVAQTAA